MNHENVQNNKELEALLENLKRCRKCQEEFGWEPRPIQWGNPDAKIMQISQAPSRKVHETGIPFNDPSGKRLRQEWYQIPDEMFYDKDLFYITQMGHCFPGKGKGNYDKKPPRCCYEIWTSKEIELIDSCEIYIIVGGEAAARLFPKKKLTDLVFEDQILHGKPCYVLPHPSPLNRRWFAAHPEFEQQRLPQIRAKIHEVLGISTDPDED